MIKLLPSDFFFSRLLMRDFCPFPDFEDKICLPSFFFLRKIKIPYLRKILSLCLTS